MNHPIAWPVFLIVVVSLANARANNVTAWGKDVVYPPSAQGVSLRHIRAGVYHNLALANDGTVVAWGNNEQGQCALPEGASGIVAIAGGDRHSIAARQDGAVLVWGLHGILSPPSDLLPELQDVVDVAAGAFFSLALKQDGTVRVWGEHDQFNYGVYSVPADMGKVVGIACGYFHCLAVNDVGKVFAWGLSGACSIPQGLPRILMVSGGGAHSLALDSEGKVHAWGVNDAGQAVVPAAALEDVVLIDAGGSHNVALKRDGTAVIWGDHQGTYPGPYLDVSAGWYYTIALAVDGSVATWGRDSHQQLRPPAGPQNVIDIAAGRSSERSWLPEDPQCSLILLADGSVQAWGVGEDWDGQREVPGNLGPAIAVGAGAHHSLALLADGTVRAWGAKFNNYGQLRIPAGLVNVVAISAGDFHSLALCADGSVVAWGDTSAWKCDVPADLSAVKAIAAGGEHSLALLADGSVRGWGANWAQQYSPLHTHTGFIAVSAGRSHSLALRADGTVFACGSNREGQCDVPTGLSEVVAIAAGSYHSLALTRAGTVVGWGVGAPDSWGYLNYSQTTIPAGLRGVSAISAGSAHNLALYSPSSPPTDDPPVAVAGEDILVVAGVDCLANVLVNGEGSWDPDGDGLRYRWELFLGEESLTVVSAPIANWSLPPGNYDAVLTVWTGPDGATVSSQDRLTIQVALRAPELVSLNPEVSYVGGPGFDLEVSGGCFTEDAVLYWNGVAINTTFVSGSKLIANIPGNYLSNEAGPHVAAVQVRNGDAQWSNLLGFGIVPQVVSDADASVVEPGQTTTVSTAPTTAGDAGVTVQISNSGDTSITVLAASYEEEPVGETAFKVGNGAFVDVQVTGASSALEATVFFYYPSSPKADESVRLQYFDGSKWDLVLSKGGLPPIKDTTDNLDGTISSGRFTVIFDSTSTPPITELEGTVFGVFSSPPQIASIAGPLEPLALGTSVGIEVRYVALGDPAGVKVGFRWGDGTMTEVIPAVDGVALAFHDYRAAGVYTVVVQVTDSKGDSSEARFEQVVLFNPEGGFVAGGGLIDSPAGACLQDPIATGTATFAFVSRYTGGKSSPTGNAEFQFQAGSLRFHSSLLEWLVVSGAKAQFKGVGMINGRGDYGFLLTATDGQLRGSADCDRFRIKIWNRATIETVYDNMLGASDELAEAVSEVIIQGSIVIHKSP